MPKVTPVLFSNIVEASFLIIMQLKDINNVKWGREMSCLLGIINGGQLRFRCQA